LWALQVQTHGHSTDPGQRGITACVGYDNAGNDNDNGDECSGFKFEFDEWCTTDGVLYGMRTEVCDYGQSYVYLRVRVPAIRPDQ
jgi:hypothetical protein